MELARKLDMEEARLRSLEIRAQSRLHPRSEGLNRAYTPNCHQDHRGHRSLRSACTGLPPPTFTPTTCPMSSAPLLPLATLAGLRHRGVRMTSTTWPMAFRWTLLCCHLQHATWIYLSTKLSQPTSKHGNHSGDQRRRQARWRDGQSAAACWHR